MERGLLAFSLNLGEIFMYQSYLAVCQFKFKPRIFNFGDEILRGQKENQQPTLLGPDVIWTQPFASGSRTRGARNLSAPLALRWKLFAGNCGYTRQTVWHILIIQSPKGSGMEGRATQGAVWVSRVEQDVNTNPHTQRKLYVKSAFQSSIDGSDYRLLIYSKWRMTKWYLKR